MPEPSRALPGEVAIALPTSVGLKVSLLNAMLKRQLRPVDLAKIMGIKPQEVNRLLDMKHATKIDTLDAALQAVGLKLEMKVKAV